MIRAMVLQHLHLVTQTLARLNQGVIMSGMVPFFLTGANAKIRVNGRTMAFCTNVSYSTRVMHKNPKILGMCGVIMRPRLVQSSGFAVATRKTSSGSRTLWPRICMSRSSRRLSSPTCMRSARSGSSFIAKMPRLTLGTRPQCRASSSERQRPSATFIGSISPIRSAMVMSGVASFSA